MAIFTKNGFSELFQPIKQRQGARKPTQKQALMGMLGLIE
jgi:hypothetical protein